MEYNRASEIINSPKTINVTYNGEHVWLKTINESNKTAVVSPATEGEPDMTVSLNELNEL